MLALLAVVCFILAAFNVAVAGLNLVALGLAFMAAYFIAPWSPWPSRAPYRGN